MTVKVEELAWSEQPLGEVEFPAARLTLSRGLGSGLAAIRGSNGALVWAIGDRGPNIKLKEAEEMYGWTPPPQWQSKPGVKVMLKPEIGPALALLEISGNSVALKQVIPITGSAGSPVPGIPVPESSHAECEPALGLDGTELAPDPSGMDTEGVALLPDGSFWIGEEYGPSLVHVAADGAVIERFVPEGVNLSGSAFPVRAALPAIAARRQLNRGFEALTITPSGKHLYLAFQSPLAHPSVDEHEAARHVRVWQLDLAGKVTAQFLYQLDEPESFHRDCGKGEFERSDIKVCELAALNDHSLLAIERGDETTKIYRVAVDPALALPPEHLDIATRPTIEERSCRGDELPSLAKELLFNSDEWPDFGPDMEGLAMLDERTLLIVSDNDFGCEGKQTRFYRLTFDRDLAR